MELQRTGRAGAVVALGALCLTSMAMADRPQDDGAAGMSIRQVAGDDANVTAERGGFTIWSGYDLTFTKADGADWTLPANQDQITPNVALTRADNQGLFNIAQEAFYNDGVSPVDTEWAFGTTADLPNLAFTDWLSWNGATPPSMVGQNAVVHLISDDIYIDIRFTSWTSGGAGGGFSYDRGTPPDPDGCPGPIVYDNGSADLVTGVAPTAGWTSEGIIDDFFLPSADGTVIDCFSADFLEIFGDGTHETMRVQIYDISAGGIAGLGDYNTTAPIFDVTVSIAGGDLVHFDTGLDAFGLDVVRFVADLPTTDLGPGQFGVHLTFPGTGFDGFWASAPQTGGASECGHVWGTTVTLPDDACIGLGPELENLAFEFRGPEGGVNCPEDLTGDGEVNSDDLFQLLGAWGPCLAKAEFSTTLDGGYSVAGEITYDGGLPIVSGFGLGGTTGIDHMDVTFFDPAENELFSTVMVTGGVSSYFFLTVEWDTAVPNFLAGSFFDIGEDTGAPGEFYHLGNIGDFSELFEVAVGSIDSAAVTQFDVKLISDDCPEDLTGDGEVNSDDLFQLLGAWGDC